MSNTYTIRNSLNAIITTIGETQKDKNSTSLVLHGRGAKNYGFERDQNHVYLLENFSNTTGPANPINGQLWWDRSIQELCVWDSTLGSPTAWISIVPTSQGLGFEIEAGTGLTGGGQPSGIPLTTTLDIGQGTGITVTADAISANDPGIDHDGLLNFGSPQHINHSSVSIIANNGLTGGGSLTTSRTLNVIGGAGITANANDIAISSSVVRTSGNQTISGIKTWTTQILADAGGTAAAPSYGFDGDTDTGWYVSGPNELSFTTGGTQRFRIETGGVLRSLNATYEALVTEDDDIPNKKYVDDTVPAGTSPTATFTSTSGSVSGLTIGKKYLVSIYGITRDKGSGNNTLYGARIGTGLTIGGGSTLAAAPSQYIDWFDGNNPQSGTFVITATATTMNGAPDWQSSGSRGTPFTLTTVQLD